MQQSLENLIKACLKKENISWESGSKGHRFQNLLNLGSGIKFLEERILSRPDFLSLLKELEDGYNTQRYGESGHFIEGHEKMMDLFDEMIYILITEFAILVNQNNNERLMALPVPIYIEPTFKRNLKQPFIFGDVLSLDN